MARLGIRAHGQLEPHFCATTGHCFGADPFINYATARDFGRLSPGDRYLMVAVGLGANFAATVVEH